MRNGAILGFLLLWIGLLPALRAQDSTAVKPKTDTLKSRAHSPRKAALYSAILPGLGQAYNRKYWKIGIIAAGTGALVYSFQFNQRYYRQFKGELIQRQQDLGGEDPSLALYSDANLLELQDFYRRNRDLTVIGFGLLYAANIIDAVVDAHLFDFNVDESLSLRWQPSLQPASGGLAFCPQFGLQYRF